MAEEALLDIEKTYAAVLTAAREKRFIAYGDLAEANGVRWQKVRRLIPHQLGQLATIAHKRGWPLLTAIVVTKENLESGRIEGTARDGFLGAAKMVGIEVDDPESFIRDQQEKVFEWAKTAPETLKLEDEASASSDSPRFVQYCAPVLDALRALGGKASPAEVFSWIREHLNVPAKEVEALTQGGQSKFENKVGWARFYLAKAGLIDGSRRGIWALTPEGQETRLDHEGALELFRNVRARFRTTADDDEPAPDTVSGQELFDDPARQFWFVGAFWNNIEDQLGRFLEEGIWENGYDDKFSKHVMRMKPGELRIRARGWRPRGSP